MKKNGTFIREREGENGFVLITFYMLIPLILILAGAVMAYAWTEARATQRTQASLQAFYVAEGGIDQAVVQLRSDPSWAGGSSSVGGAGNYVVAVQNLGNNRVRLTSSGTNNLLPTPTNRAVEAIVRVTPRRSFPYAILGNQPVSMTDNAFTDSYDSSQGPYNPLSARANGAVKTNADAPGSLTLSGNVTVRGDGIVGPGGDTSTAIVVTGNARITGQREVGQDVTPLPPVTIPGGLVNGGDLSVSGNNTVTLPGGTYWYNNVTVSGTGQLYFDGPTTIYLSGSLNISGNGVSSVNYLPSDLQIQVQGIGNITYSGNSRFYGTVYAPQAPININGNGNLYGGFVGQTITVAGNGGIHYDEALLLNGVRSSNQVQFISWRDLSS